jgi:hypothetical protein
MYERYLPCPSFHSAASAASAASSTSLPFPILHHSSANAIPHGALACELRLAPGQRVPNSAHRHFRSFSRKTVSFLYSRTATGLLSNIASSVVPVHCVPACRHSFPPAKRRAGPSSIPTSLSRSTRVSRQHTVRLGRLSALPDPTPSLASSCFPWPLPVAIYRLLKSPCRMRHMEQTRHVALDNLFPKAPLDANPRIGSACACCRAYHQFPIPSLLLPPVSPAVDSSAIHPLHNQPCSTSSHHRCWPPAGHTAPSPPRLHTTLTGAPFRSTNVYTSAFPQSQPSSRFPSQLLSAYHPLHPSSQRPRSSSPILFKVLLLCFTLFSRTDFVVSQLPPFAKYRSKELGALCIFFVILSIHWL